jgi:hypothetical protein
MAADPSIVDFGFPDAPRIPGATQAAEAAVAVCRRNRRRDSLPTPRAYCRRRRKEVRHRMQATTAPTPVALRQMIVLLEKTLGLE